jgi:hypothetical protein
VTWGPVNAVSIRTVNMVQVEALLGTAAPGTLCVQMASAPAFLGKCRTPGAMSVIGFVMAVRMSSGMEMGDLFH